MGLQIDSLPEDPTQFGSYMAALDDKQLDRLEEGLAARFNDVYGDGENIDEEGVASLTGIRDKLTSVRAEKTRRAQAALDAETREAADRQKDVLARLKASVQGGSPTPEPVGSDGAAVDASGFPKQFAQSLLEAIGAVTASAVAKGPDLNKHIRNLPLGDAARHAPDPKVQPRREEPVILASGDLPGMQIGNRIKTFEDLVRVMHARSRMMSTTRGRPQWTPVASMERDFRYRLSLDSTPDEVDEVLRAARDTDALVAAGGWCAPSEISYDFYNIVAEDGLVDLPSVGVLNRGGLRFPTSPSIADIFTTSALWNWTEAEDIEAQTSTSQVKTCARVACPTFSEVRASCDGLCVTVGNLVDFAYPEMVQNHIRLVFAARAHLTNNTIITAMAADAKVQTVTLTATLLPADQSGVASILSAVELQAEDIRNRYRMTVDSILEAVFPHWVLGIFRADLANRAGVDLLSVTNGQIADWLNQRGVRAQFVYDWQAGFSANAFGHPSTEITAWPTTAQFLMYPAGTYVRGQGLQLDLGVVRDSDLNSQNDHTGAWMEDCYAVAAIGHESRLVTVNTRVSGETGALVVGAQT